MNIDSQTILLIAVFAVLIIAIFMVTRRTSYEPYTSQGQSFAKFLYEQGRLPQVNLTEYGQSSESVPKSRTTNIALTQPSQSDSSIQNSVPSSTANIALTYGKWTAYPDNKVDGAEISNDTTGFKELMIVGNKSKGNGLRNVGVWDKLDIHGKLCVNGKCLDENSYAFKQLFK
jgi:hypothetical protein